MEWIKGFIEENEDARQQLYDGDITAFKRLRDGGLWPIEKGEWSDDNFWDFARRTGHVRATVASTAPLFIKKEVEQPDTTTGGVEDRNDDWPEYTPPYVAFMRRAIQEMGLKPGTRIPKETIEGWLRENWPDKLDKPTERKIKHMATFLRHPKDELGGYFKPNRDE